jgi:hypothetical protein
MGSNKDDCETDYADNCESEITQSVKPRISGSVLGWLHLKSHPRAKNHEHWGFIMA